MKKAALFILLALFGGSCCLLANLPCTADNCSGGECETCDASESESDSPSDGKDVCQSSGEVTVCKKPHPPPAGSGDVHNNSFNVAVHFGSPGHEPVSLSGRFSLYSIGPTPLLFTPQLLQYRNLLLDRISQTDVAQAHAERILGTNWEELIENSWGGGFARLRVDNGLGAGTTHQVRLFTAKREQLLFQFRVGDAVGRPTGDTATARLALRMRDAAGADTATLPAFYDLCFGNGDRVRYSAATGAVVSCHTTSGRVITPADAGLLPVYDAEGNIRQIWSRADGLADVAVTELGVSYEIRFYSPSQVRAPVDGLYAVSGPPHTVWRIENPNPGSDTRANVTKTVGGQSDLWEFEYSHASEGWLLKQPGNLAVTSQTVAWDVSNTAKTVTMTQRTPSGTVASRTSSVVQTFPFGSRKVVSTRDPGSANLVTSWSYYENPADPGSYGRLRSVSDSDGGWTMYRYDARGRTAATVTPWRNAAFGAADNASKVELNSYLPHDPRDTAGDDDTRPRTEETRILGIKVAKTFHAYYADNGGQVVITERCARPDAAYGDTDNLRTEWRYYPGGEAAGSASAGRLRSVSFPNGVMDSFTYEYGLWQPDAGPAVPGVFTPGSGFCLRVTATRGTTASPAGIAGRTLRLVSVFDEAGNEVLAARQVYTGAGHAPLDWRLMTYDGLRRPLSERKSNGELTETTWNCCAKASETLPDGTRHTYAYDSLGRLLAKTRLGAGGQPDLVTSYTYNAAGRVLSETLSGGVLSSSATNTYDLAGRLTSSVGHQGLTTLHTHLPGVNTGSQRRGTATTITHPGGFTTITETFCDGQLASMTGDAQVPQYYDYGVNADGSQWTLVRSGGGDSPRWRKTTTGLSGRTILLEKSGYGGTLAEARFYGAAGQLIRTERGGQAATLYEYDALGLLLRSGLDTDGDGVLTPASNDRISETGEEYLQDAGGDWWRVETQKIYAVADGAATTTVSTSRQRLSGFASGVVSESESLDIHGNVTSQTLALDRAAKTVITSTLYPDSGVAEQQISVNGLVTSVRSRSNLITTFAYDGLGRRISVTDPRTGTSTIVYHTAAGKIGLVASETDAAGNSTNYDYDTASGRLLWRKNALDQYTRYAYNTRGQQTRVWGDAEYPVEYGYDAYGQKITMTTFRSGDAWNAAAWPRPRPGRRHDDLDL